MIRPTSGPSMHIASLRQASPRTEHELLARVEEHLNTSSLQLEVDESKRPLLEELLGSTSPHLLVKAYGLAAKSLPGHLVPLQEEIMRRMGNEPFSPQRGAGWGLIVELREMFDDSLVPKLRSGQEEALTRKLREVGPSVLLGCFESASAVGQTFLVEPHLEGEIKRRMAPQAAK